MRASRERKNPAAGRFLQLLSPGGGQSLYVYALLPGIVFQRRTRVFVIVHKTPGLSYTKNRQPRVRLPVFCGVDGGQCPLYVQLKSLLYKQGVYGQVSLFPSGEKHLLNVSASIVSFSRRYSAISVSCFLYFASISRHFPYASSMMARISASISAAVCSE